MNANAYKMCFWLLAHTVYEPSLLMSIRSEITPAIREGKIDINYLVEEKNCPVLNAAFNENLRYTSAATSGRVVLSPTIISNKTLYPGARVLMPYQPSHFNDEVFGSNVSSFDPTRFIERKDLTKNPAYRPFGGGSQYCSGRFLARREVIGFLAFVSDRFDIELSNTGSIDSSETGVPHFPRLDVNKPNLGIISPVRGDDLYVSIKPRKKQSI